MPNNFERWKAEYKVKLLAAIKRNPDSFGLAGYTHEEYAERVGEKMANSFLESPYSVNVSNTMRTAAKRCGAPSTSMKAIHRFITEG